MRELGLVLLWLGLFLGPVGAVSGAGLEGPPRLALERALERIRMTTNDVAFERDIAEPRMVLPVVRDMLRAPLGLPALGDELLSAAVQGSNGIGGLWELVARALGQDPAIRNVSMPPAVTNGYLAGLDLAPLAAERQRVWKERLGAFLETAGRVDAWRAQAFAALDGETRRDLGCEALAGIFNAEDLAETREVMEAAGFERERIARVVEEGLALDPAPAAGRLLGAVERIDLAALLAGARQLDEAARTLAAAVREVSDWPEEPMVLETALGRIWIGSTNDDAYAEAALLILDPGGDDHYSGGAGVADGLGAVGLAVIVDLAGDDTYDGRGLLAPGAALFGLAVLHDHGGDDRYRAAYAGQAGALFGAALLEDAGGGRDRYEAQALAQGAAYVGVGILSDDGGNNAYDLGFYGQGFGGLAGVGLLIDRGGDDRYHAGRRLHDFDRHDDRYVSMAQGFGIGLRPFGGGGLGALIDLDGNDSYEADVYGQGVGYWYGLGMLLDRAGDDVYSAYHYAQGTGIHLACGLLMDGAGSDRYVGHILAQGSAHDYAVGVLVERGGDDHYGADHHAQGRAFFNSFALLLDEGGNDVYAGRDAAQCQGAGHDGDKREYGSLALLLDLGGRDAYSVEGATNGVALPRPHFGILWDQEPISEGH